MRTVLFFMVVLLSSCFKINSGSGPGEPPAGMVKVWGSRPVYEAPTSAKVIAYIPQRQILHTAGNIYAFRNYLFQVDVGRGIHIIDNTNPATADRIGFITVNGCQQISVRGSYIYTNSYADLVTIDISDALHAHEVSRVKDAFPEMQANYPLVQPEESGYFECPRYDSVVVRWVKDSVYNYCYKN